MSIPFHETLREANRAAWETMQAHLFVRAIEAGRLPRMAFLRYLAYERDFVATAIPIFAEALIKAPGFAEQRHLIGTLRALAEEQMPYFDATFSAIGATPLPRERFPPAVAAFREGMHAIARTGSYAEIMTAMLAAEWMYATWCSRAAERPIPEPHLARWVALHAAPDFWAQVAWLKRQVDAAGAGAEAAEQAVLVRRFGEALDLEIAFHAAPLGLAMPG
jgi:thiaminase (transcriptional activator TenA)